jgi:anti-sigma regulatory factor (Ser/Thr protein kinase)
MRNHMVELRRIDSWDSVHEVSDLIEEVLLVHGRALTNRIKAIVSELANNIVDHSFSHGYAAVQYYPMKKQVEIALGDGGVGIARSLEGLYPNRRRKSLVEEAFQDQVSTLVDEDRGYGLGEVRTRTAQKGGYYEFRLLTNGGLYRIYEDSIVEEADGEYVPYGTYYQIKLWEDV